MQKLEIPNRGYIPRENEIDTIFTIVNDNMFTVVYRNIEYKVTRFADVCEISAVIEGVTWIAERSFGMFDYILKHKKTCGKISMSWTIMRLLTDFGVMQTPIALPSPDVSNDVLVSPIETEGNPSYVAGLSSTISSNTPLYKCTVCGFIDCLCAANWHDYKYKFHKYIEKIPIANAPDWRAIA